jgi:hypothetical protein
MPPRNPILHVEARPVVADGGREWWLWIGETKRKCRISRKISPWICAGLRQTDVMVVFGKPGMVR